MPGMTGAGFLIYPGRCEDLKQMIGRPELLQFNEFKRMYSDYSVPEVINMWMRQRNYNAYTFIENLGVTICPYCDEEYLDVVENGNGGKLRTLEIDHSFRRENIRRSQCASIILFPAGRIAME